MNDLQVSGVILVAVILGLTQAAKKVFGLSEETAKRVSPAVAVVLGAVAGVFYLANGDVKTGVLIGISLGLNAVGLYSGTRNTIGK